MPITGQPVRLRIVLVAPPAGVAFALQRGKAELVNRTISTGADLTFELTIERIETHDFRGPFVQGKRGDRFVYVCSGSLAHQPESSWTRRLKVKLAGAPLTDKLEARLEGTARDGGPACATCPLIDGWLSR